MRPTISRSTCKASQNPANETIELNLPTCQRYLVKRPPASRRAIRGPCPGRRTKGRSSARAVVSAAFRKISCHRRAPTSPPRTSVTVSHPHVKVPDGASPQVPTPPEFLSDAEHSYRNFNPKIIRTTKTHSKKMYRFNRRQSRLPAAGTYRDMGAT